MRRLLANLMWALSCLPDYGRFAIALWFPEQAQRAVARRQKRHAGEAPLRQHPTSGSTGGTKWIPYTPELQREFQRGINPWIFALYLRHPGLLTGTHYWSISPGTRDEKGGFGDDSSYLSLSQRWVARQLFTVPASVGATDDPERHALATLWYLLRDPHLALVSVWHPSFWLILLNTARRQADELCRHIASGECPDGHRDTPMPERARQLHGWLTAAETPWPQIWPKLRVISCWDQARATGDAEKIRRRFPAVDVQGKGLLATEGIISIPWGRHKVAAVRSHQLHFRELPAGTPVALSALKLNHRYLTHLSCGNGFRDYPLNDIVECRGYCGRTPYLEFISRAGIVSDLRGEKLQIDHVEKCLQHLEERFGLLEFAMLTPLSTAPGYQLVTDRTPPPGMAELLEAELSTNYHYRHARQLGQLLPVRITCHPDAMKRWREMRNAAGTPTGAVKVPALSTANFC